MPITIVEKSKAKEEAQIISIRLKGSELEAVRKAAKMSKMTPGKWLKLVAIHAASPVVQDVINASKD